MDRAGSSGAGKENAGNQLRTVCIGKEEGIVGQIRENLQKTAEIWRQLLSFLLVLHGI